MASNEVAHAGIGADVTVNGLDKLVQANNELSKMKQFASDLKQSMNGMQVNFKGMSDFNSVIDKLRQLKDNINAKVNIEVSGDTKLLSLMMDIKNLTSRIQSSMHSINRETMTMTDSLQRVGGEFTHAAMTSGDFEHVMNRNTQAVQHFEETFKSMMHKTSDETRAPLTGLGKIRESMDRLKAEMPHSSIFSGVFSGTLAANAFSGAISTVTGKIKEAAAAGMQYDVDQQKMNATWTTLTGNATKAKQVLSDVNQMSIKTGQSLSVVDESEQGFYHLHSNKQEASKMTSSMLNMADAVGLQTPQIQAVTQDMVNGMSRGTINNGTLNQVSQYFPMLREQMEKYEGKLHHTSQITGKELAAMAKSGKISGQDFENVFNQMGQDKYGKAAENMMKTMNGMKRTIEARVPALLGSFETPIMNAKNPLYGAISKWVSDKRTNEEFKKLGQATNKGISTITGAFGKAFNLGHGTQAMDKLMSDLTKSVTKFSDSIAKHAPQIKEFFSFAKQSSGAGLKILFMSMKALAEVTTPFVKLAIAHPKAFTILFSGLFVSKKIGSAAVSMYRMGSAFKGITKGIASTRAAMKLFGSVTNENGEIIKTFSKNGLIAKGATAAWAGVMKVATGTAKLFGKEGLIAKGAMAAWTGVTKAATAAQKLLTLAFKSSPWGWIALAIGAVITVLVELYKHFKPFRDLCNNLAKWFMQSFGNVIKWAGKLLGSIGDLAKGVGKWFGNIWQAGKEKFAHLRSDVGKSFKGMGKDLGKTQQDSNRTMKAYVGVFHDIFTGNFKKLKKDIPAYYKGMFNIMKDIGKASFDFLNDLTGGRLKDMCKTVEKWGDSISDAWKSTWNGVGHFFEGIWDWIKKTASGGINGVIGVMNGGIGAIDDVIHTFGGSSSAIGKIKEVHYATGTGAFSSVRRPITRPTMAVLNDGNDSPSTQNREMVIHPNGMGELVQGRNTKRLLAPGTEVLNAAETKMLLGMDHFAKGTGLFSGLEKTASNAWNTTKNVAGSAWDGIKDFGASIAEKVKELGKIISNPMGFLKSMFGNLTGIQGDLMQQLTQGMYAKGKDAATSWWTELMKMAKQAEGGSSSSSELLNAVMKYGSGHKYVWGATGPDSFDCSGLVQYALHKLGIDYPRTSGAQIEHAQHITRSQARTGDLVGNGEHIGVVANDSATKYFSAFNPSSKPNILMTPLNSTYFPGTLQFGRVQGLRANKSKSSKGDDNLIAKLIKSETGGFLKWVAKHMQSGVGGSFGNPAGDGVKRWIPVIKKAASAMNVSLSSGKLSQILEVMQGESGGDPTVTQKVQDVNSAEGHPAQGLLQFIPSTFAHYAVKGHDQIKNGYDQLLAVFNDSSWESDLTTHGWGPTGSRRRAKGGKTRKGETYLVGEEGPELFTPPEDGKIISHGQSKRMISKMNRSSSVKYQPIINIKGNPDDTTIEKLSKALEKHGDTLMDMLADGMGFNDEGGLTI
ncbi:tape measure protein [Nicoliella lavandulae]|uniref:Tape measure protein n=1 Tax=Nicoliella lavandulae TaxID=3082954 RepID=A0ABU8SP65_9LACO